MASPHFATFNHSRHTYRALLLLFAEVNLTLVHVTSHLSEKGYAELSVSGVNKTADKEIENE
jgi:hypothetical protein